MADRKLRVYLSSTTIDLGEIRGKLAEQLSRLGYEPVFMGQYTAATVPPLEKVQRDVASCDVYIGLFAHWYGEPIEGIGKSHTEMEYRHARDHHIPCLLFVLDGDVAWKGSWVDKGQRGVLMESLREELLQQHAHTISLFKDPTDLLTTVQQALQEESQRRHTRSTELVQSPRQDVKGDAVVGLRFQDVHHFKNRTEELLQIQRILADPSVKVLCIIGRSGAGKTALVSRFGELIEGGGFRSSDSGAAVDGILYFSCRRAGDIVAERLWYDICQWLPPQKRDELRKIWTDGSYSEEEKFRQLLARFQHGRHLVFLDAFESVTSGEEVSGSGLKTFLEVCLRTPHSLRIVITADANVELPVDAKLFCRQLNLDRGLPDTDAIELLRSLDADGELELASASDELLLRVVQRCDGLPRTLIAIVGILANDETLSVERLLDDPTIWTKIIEEQYERYSPDRRRVLEVLAVFDRPVPREAVDHVILRLARDAADDPFASEAHFDSSRKVRRCLSDLVHGQIVAATRNAGTYEIQPKMQEYSYGRIPEEGTHYSRRRCHQLAADYFSNRRKPQGEWLSIEDIQPQLDEFEHRVRAGQYDIAADLLDLIDEEFLQLWGRYQLLIKMHERLVDHLQDAGRAHRTLGSLAISYRRIGRLGDAIRFFEKAIGRAQGDPTALANLHTELANTLADCVEMDRAIAEYRNAIEIASHNGDLASEARALGNLAIAYRQLGQVDLAIQHYEEALQRDRRQLEAARTGDETRVVRRWYANHTGNLGKALLALGHRRKALTCLAEAVATMDELHYVYGSASFQHHEAEAALLVNDFPAAIELCEKASAQLSEIGEARILTYVFHTQALAHCHQNHFDVALELCRRGLELHVPETRHEFWLLSGIVHLAMGDRAAAQHDFDAAITVCNEVIAATPHYYEALYCRGIAELATERHEESLETFQSAMSVCSAAGVRHAVLGELSLLSHAAPQTPGLSGVRGLLERDLPALC